MPALGDRLISARTAYPDAIVRAETHVARLALVRDGVAVSVADVGACALFDGGGTIVATAIPVLNAGGVLEATFSAAVTADLELGQLFQFGWNPTITGQAAAELFRREAVVSRIRLSPPVSDYDLTVGNYPDLVANLGGFAATGGAGESTLQPYIDEAFAWTLRRLYKVGRWADLLVSTHDVYDVVRERSWFLVFRFLFRTQGGDGSRFETLMDTHGKNAEAELATLTGRWDENMDGLADSVDREAAATVIHRNIAPRRRLSNSRKW